MNFLKQHWNKIDLIFKQDKVKYLLNYIIFVLGLALTLFYCYIEYYVKDSNGNILMKSGAILIFHGAIIEYTLSSIKDYIPINIKRMTKKRILVEKEVANAYKIQKKMSFCYIAIGTILWGFGDWMIILN